MSDFLDRIRLAIAAELERFEADERRRLAYADRSPMLEQRDRKMLPDGHLGECVLTIDDGWRCAVGCRDAQLAAAERSAERQLADGTGRHSRKEMEQAEATHRPFTRPWPCTRCGAAADRDCTHIAGAAMAGDYGPEIHVERLTPKDPTPVVSGPALSVIAGVQFSSVPALCAAFEQLLSASAAYLWTWRPDREHCSGPQMEAYRELRRLVAGAGKDVP